MRLTKGYTSLFFLLLYITVLGIVAATTPISPSEAYLFFQEKTTATTLLIHGGQTVLSGELGLRLPFLLLGLLNAFLFYKVATYTFDKEEDRFMALFFYLMLPGVILSSVLANDAVIITSLVLLFLFFSLKGDQFLSLMPLLLLSLVHWSALYFYMIIMLYGLFQKERWIFLASIAALVLYALIGIDAPQSSTQSHFLELLGIYAMIFSPLLFIYLFYALYRTLLRGEKDMVWYISFGALIISLGLSLQERIKITDFSAYLMLGMIIAVRTYYQSLRVRLRAFRYGYRVIFWLVTVSLMISAFSILLHQPIYRLIGKANYAIVTPVYEPYDRVRRLQSEGKTCLEEVDRKVRQQMRYYGLNKCF